MSKRNKKLAKEFQGIPCIVCGSCATTVGDHILTVGSRPDLADKKFNVWPLCFSHHREKERSLTNFVTNNNLTTEMTNRGFDFSYFTWKWFHPEGD